MSLKMNLSLSLPNVDQPIFTGDASWRRNCRQLAELFKKMASGNLPRRQLGAVHAYGTVTLDTCSGTLVVVVDGTAITVSHNTDDATDGAALAAAINANATLKPKVLARYNSTTKILTIQSKVAGLAGNYTLSASGTGLTASGAALTLGVDETTLDLRTSASAAYGWILASGGALSGAVGATIGGTLVTATAAGGDNQTLKLIAGAINANATVSKWVRAHTAPLSFATLTATDAGAVTITINGIDCTITAGGTEDTDGASLVTAINALTGSHGCVARYFNATNQLHITSLEADKKIKLAASGAGATTVTIGGRAAQTISIDAVTADVITVTVDGVACSITATNTDEDTQGALLVTAINAKNAQHKCTASYATGGGGGAAGTLTITSDYAGAVGNEITLAISGAGKGSSAVAGAVLAGGLDKCVLTCLVPGVIGNSLSLVASGTNAAVDGTPLSGGAESRVAYTF